MKDLIGHFEEAILELNNTPVNKEVSALPITYSGLNGALVILRDIAKRKLVKKTRDGSS